MRLYTVADTVQQLLLQRLAGKLPPGAVMYQLSNDDAITLDAIIFAVFGDPVVVLDTVQRLAVREAV